MIGKAVLEAGYEHRLSWDVLYQPLGSCTWGDMFGRRARWIRCRKYMEPLATVGEPLTESVLSGILTALAARHVWYPAVRHGPLIARRFFAVTWRSTAPSTASLFLWHMLFWAVCDAVIASSLMSGYAEHSQWWKRVGGKNASPNAGGVVSTVRNTAAYAAAWVIREATAFPSFLAAIASNEVTWRNKRYRVSRLGVVRSIGRLAPDAIVPGKP